MESLDQYLSINRLSTWAIGLTRVQSGQTSSFAERQTELKIYDGGPTKILEYKCGWDAGPGGYRVMAVFQTRDGTELQAWMPVDAYVKSEDAKALTGQDWEFIIRQVSWRTWLQLPFSGIINAMCV